MRKVLSQLDGWDFVRQSMKWMWDFRHVWNKRFKGAVLSHIMLILNILWNRWSLADKCDHAITTVIMKRSQLAGNFHDIHTDPRTFRMNLVIITTYRYTREYCFDSFTVELDVQRSHRYSHDTKTFIRNQLDWFIVYIVESGGLSCHSWPVPSH